MEGISPSSSMLNITERITRRLPTEMIEAFRTFIRIYSSFKNERLSANIKLTLHKALTRSVMTYASPHPLGINGRHLPLKIAVPAK
jgi:hypothetical protein